MNKLSILTICVALLCIACGNKNKSVPEEQDLAAKKALQGVWVDEEDDDVAFRIKGDTVYFPDSTSMPVYFMMKRDSFILCGANRVAYPVVKHTPHLFVFVSQNGEQVRLVKGDDAAYMQMFSPRKTAVAINHHKLLKQDTVVVFNDERYHSYVQVNPTTYKVVKASYNDDGVEVDNVYYDNIIHLGLYQGNRKIYSQNVLKSQFSSVVPAGALEQAVFSNLVFLRMDKEGAHYNAVLAIPDSMTSYIVEFIVDYNGKATIKEGK